MTLPEDGSLRSRVAQLEQQLAELQRSDRLIAASVGSGGLTVKDGGEVAILDGDGDPALTLSADQGLLLAGLLKMLAGGNIETYDADDELRVEIGNVIFVHGTTGESMEINDNGILVNDSDGNPFSWVQTVGAVFKYDDKVNALVITDEFVVSSPGSRGVVLRVNETDGLRLAVDTAADGIQTGQVTAGAAGSGGAGFRLLRIPN